jgi:integrase
LSLYRRPGSPYLWTKLYVGGQVIRQSTRQRTKAKALREEARILGNLERVARLEGRHTLGDLADDFLEWKRSAGRSPETVNKLKEHLEVHVLPFFGDTTDVRMIDDAGLAEYRAARMAKVKPITVSKELATLRQMFLYAAETKHLFDRAPTVRNPTARYEPKWKFLSADQLVRLLGELANRRSREVLPFFLLLANTGMRSGETLKMTWDMVDFAARKLRLPGSIRKTRKPLTLDITEGAEAALRMLWRPGYVGRVFSQKSFRGALRVSCVAAGLPAGLRPHDFRHTLASLMHANGTPPTIVRDQLGHTTMAMVNLYAHSFDEARQKAAEAVSVLPPSVLSTGSEKH